MGEGARGASLVTHALSGFAIGQYGGYGAGTLALSVASVRVFFLG